MKRLSIVMTLCIIAMSFFVNSSHADYTWYSHNGHDYALTSAVNWESAQTEALAVGADLVTINDGDEETWLRSTFGTGYLWIGFTDKTTEQTWVWISGEAVTYTNWAGGEPNNSGGEDYAVMNWSGIKWNDLSGSQSYRGIMEKAIVPLPPSAMLLLPGLAALVGLKRRSFI